MDTLGPYLVERGPGKAELLARMKKDYNEFVRVFGPFPILEDPIHAPLEFGLRSMRRKAGEFAYRLQRGNVFYPDKFLERRINLDIDYAKFDDQRKRVMFHEMIHAVDDTFDPTDRGHGRFFVEMMNRVNARYGAGYVTKTSDLGSEEVRPTRDPFTVYWAIHPKTKRIWVAMSKKSVSVMEPKIAETMRINIPDTKYFKSTSTSLALSKGVEWITPGKGVSFYGIEPEKMRKDDMDELIQTAKEFSRETAVVIPITYHVYWTEIRRQSKIFFSVAIKEFPMFNQLSPLKLADKRVVYVDNSSEIYKSKVTHEWWSFTPVQRRNGDPKIFSLPLSQMPQSVRDELMKTAIPLDLGTPY